MPSLIFFFISGAVAFHLSLCLSLFFLFLYLFLLFFYFFPFTHLGTLFPLPLDLLSLSLGMMDTYLGDLWLRFVNHITTSQADHDTTVNPRQQLLPARQLRRRGSRVAAPTHHSYTGRAALLPDVQDLHPTPAS